MERLTTYEKFDFDDTVYAAPNYECTELGDSDLKDWAYRAAAKLAKYEDAEDAGTLLILPCQIGTPIYWLVKTCKMPEEFKCNYDCHHCDECLPEIYETHFRLGMLDDSGELHDGYYVNKSDAEERLEEMKKEIASKK